MVEASSTYSGQQSAGKSTVLCAVAEEEKLLPISRGACTRTPIRVSLIGDIGSEQTPFNYVYPANRQNPMREITVNPYCAIPSILCMHAVPEWGSGYGLGLEDSNCCHNHRHGNSTQPGIAIADQYHAGNGTSRGEVLDQR